MNTFTFLYTARIFKWFHEVNQKTIAGVGCG
jgi:hypothetical protein